MKVLIVSKILVVAAYRRKLDEIARQPEIDQLLGIVRRHVLFELDPDSGRRMSAMLAEAARPSLPRNRQRTLVSGHAANRRQPRLPTSNRVRPCSARQSCPFK